MPARSPLCTEEDNVYWFGNWSTRNKYSHSCKKAFIIDCQLIVEPEVTTAEVPPTAVLHLTATGSALRLHGADLTPPYVRRMGLNSRLMQTNGLQTKYLSNVQNPWLIQLKHRNLVPEDSNMFAVTEQIPAFRTWMHNPRPGSGPERVLSGPPSRLKNTGNFSWSTEILWMNLNFIELLASFQLIKSETARMAIILNHKHYKG